MTQRNTQELEPVEAEDALQARFAARRSMLERMAEEAVEQDKQGLTLDLDETLEQNLMVPEPVDNYSRKNSRCSFKKRTMR